MDLVIIDPINKDHFLFYDKSRLFNDNKKLFMSDLMSNLPSTKKLHLNQILSLAREKDKRKVLINQRL